MATRYKAGQNIKYLHRASGAFGAFGALMCFSARWHLLMVVYLSNIIMFLILIVCSKNGLKITIPLRAVIF